MKTGNYQVKGGKVHRYVDDKHYRNPRYLCGLYVSPKDKRVSSLYPVTCKSCIKAMGRMK